MDRKKILPLEPLTSYFIFMGILPPCNVMNNKKLHIIKIVVMVFIFTVTNFATFITRFSYFKHPLGFNIVDSLTNILVWQLVIGTLCYSYTHKEVFHNLFEELANFRDETPQQKRTFIYFAVLNVYLFIVWSCYYAPPGFKITRRYILGCIAYFEQEIIFLYYCLSISFIAVMLLLNFKRKYQHLNATFLKIRFTIIYDEDLLSQAINEGQNMFMRLSFALKMLNEVLTPLLLFLPMICCSWLLHFCLYLKHILPSYSGTLGYQMALLTYTSTLVVCSIFYNLIGNVLKI